MVKPLFALIICSFALNTAALDKSVIDKRAQAISRNLQPAKFSKGSGNDLNGVKGQVIKLIEALEQNQRSGSSAPESMISKAFQFKDKEIGKMQAMVSQQSLVRTWKNAVAMGLFNEKGKFTGTITRGRGIGDAAVFEYIVPPEVAPEYTKYIGNVRIVSADKKRETGDKLNTRDSAFLNSLKQVKSEAEARGRMLDREKSYVDSDREAMSLELYRKEVEAAGDLVNRQPNIRLRGNLAARPSHKSKNRYRVDVQLNNSSRHPTEIKLDIYVLGYTDKKNYLYVMKHETFTEKLRSSENRSYEVWTKEVGSYANNAWELDEKPMEGKKKLNRVIYKGYITIATFKDKGIVGVAASDARLLEYATGERPGLSGIPKF